MKRLKKTLPFAVVFLIFGFAVVLLFGNPGWNKWVYIAQEYYYPGNGESHIRDDEGGQLCWQYTDNLRPAKHNGLWKVWSQDGRLIARIHLKNGSAEKIVEYRPDGTIRTNLDWTSQDPGSGEDF